MDEKERIFMKYIGEPLRSQQKKIRFRETLIKLVNPELEKCGFEFNKKILFGRGPGGVYEFSRSRGRNVDILTFQNTPGFNPYLRTHAQILNYYLIVFYIVDQETHESLKLDYFSRVFIPASEELFPFQRGWAYFTQEHLKQVLKISMEELTARGLKWFDLIRAGVRGDPLFEVLGTPKSKMTQEEYDRSSWRQRFTIT